MDSQLIGIRKPKRYQKNNVEWDLIFVREDRYGKERKIFVSLPTDEVGWFQWGEDKDILSDNVEDLEQ